MLTTFRSSPTARRTDENPTYINCTVAFAVPCMSLRSCRLHCADMGASRVRWFFDGCCQCIGPHCIEYGVLQSRCEDCPERLEPTVGVNGVFSEIPLRAPSLHPALLQRLEPALVNDWMLDDDDADGEETTGEDEDYVAEGEEDEDNFDYEEGNEGDDEYVENAELEGEEEDEEGEYEFVDEEQALLEQEEQEEETEYVDDRDLLGLSKLEEDEGGLDEDYDDGGENDTAESVATEAKQDYDYADYQMPQDDSKPHIVVM